MSAPKVGDVVHVRGVVTDVCGNARSDALSGKVHVDFGEGRNGLWAAPHDIVHIEPRALSIGDMVRWKQSPKDIGPNPPWEILALADGYAWVRRNAEGSKRFESRWLNDVERA